MHFNFLNAEPHIIERRSTYDHKKNTCPLLLVADHRFYKHMGRGEESTTLNYLVSNATKLHTKFNWKGKTSLWLYSTTEQAVALRVRSI